LISEFIKREINLINHMKRNHKSEEFKKLIAMQSKRREAFLRKKKIVKILE
jgi:hypothetical protein